MSKSINWLLALCNGLDHDIFFEPEHEDTAVAVCLPCPIRIECLTYALEKPERYGVWGGLTEYQRKKLSFKRHRVKCPSCSSPEVDELPQRTEVCRSCGLSWQI